MRCAFALLLGALVGLVAFDTATATSSGELLPSCLEIVNRARPVSGGDIDIPPSGLSCWHYMAAISERVGSGRRAWRAVTWNLRSAGNNFDRLHPHFRAVCA